MTNNGVVTTNYAPNNNAVANQGQLKQFTARAVDELNADLTNYGEAGAPLSNLVYGWQQDYLTNNYATNNPPYKPSDFQAVNVGQVKYVANLVYSQLSSAGYSALYPSWLTSSNAADLNAANLGQLKEAFNFDLSLKGPSNLVATQNTNGVINLSWTLPSTNQATSYIIEQQTVSGFWTNIATITNPTETSYAVTNLAAGKQPAFQIIAQSGSSSASLAQDTPADPNLVLPTNVHSYQGASSGEIDTSWQNAGSSDATYIIVQQSEDGTHWTNVATLPPSAEFYAATNLTVGQAYFFALLVGNN